MVTIQELKAQIESANALGIANLDKKGVGILSSDTITTYDIMNMISMIETGQDGICVPLKQVCIIDPVVNIEIKQGG